MWTKSNWYLARDSDGKNVNNFCIKINHIDCDKDTYEVLSNSITEPLNRDIKFINRAGCIQVVTDIISKEVRLLICTSDHVDISQYSIKKSIPIRILMCGDLAFFAAVLGKVNMSGNGVLGVNMGL